MAEDLAELGLEAVEPIMNHDKAWQKAKSKVKSGFSSLRTPEGHQFKEENHNSKTQYHHQDGSRYEYEQSERRRRRYSDRDDNHRKNDYDLGYRSGDGQPDRRRNNQQSGNQSLQRDDGARRPRMERRASSVDRGDFEQNRSRQRRHSRREDREHAKHEANGHSPFHGIDSKDALTAGFAGIAAIYLASEFYKDHKNKEAKLGKDGGRREGRSRSADGRHHHRSKPDPASPRR